MTVAVPPISFEHPVDVTAAVRQAKERVSFLIVPESRFLAVEGTGAPGDSEFKAAIATLYPVAYTLHFALRRRGVSSPIGALEGVYFSTDPKADMRDVLTGIAPPPLGWRWRLLLPVPAEATAADVAAAIEEVGRKSNPPAVRALRVETVPEASAAQVIHVGPYHAEAPTVRRLLDAIAAAGLTPSGGHHEIYISDPNRTSAARLRTLIRQDVRPAVVV